MDGQIALKPFAGAGFGDFRHFVIADAGFLVAYWIEEDRHHQWARSLTTYLPLLTRDSLALKPRNPFFNVRMTQHMYLQPD
ncbi:MAG TPA: hypothetical protein VHY22_08560 [Chthoniobacteraceae bacterium]|nr:hypothetical protein [Chthoniobacteraceae bacterium]